MSKPKIIVDNGYFFIVSLCIYILNLLAVSVALSQNFKNTSDFVSYFFATAGYLIIMKTFVVGYANLTYSIKNKRWYVLVANLILISFQLTCYFLSLIWFNNDTYPQTVAVYFMAASLGLVVQLVLGQLTSSIKYQITSFIYYAAIFGLLYTRAFNADVRFLQTIGVISLSLEFVMLLNLYRMFQLKDVLSIKTT